MPLTADPRLVHSLFDVISYGKGACCLRMISHYIGMDVLWEGLALLFRTRKWNSFDYDDLWDTFSRVVSHDIDLKSIMNAWIHQAGYPIVFASRSQENPETITLRQQLASFDSKLRTPCDWIIPMQIASCSGGRQKYLMQNAESVWKDSKADEWILFNGESMGYYRVYYDDALFEKILIGIARRELSTLDSLAILQDCIFFWRHYESSTQRLLRLIHALQYTPDMVVWKVITNCLVQEIVPCLETLEVYPKFQIFISNIVHNVMTDFKDKFMPENGVFFAHTQLLEHERALLALAMEIMTRINQPISYLHVSPGRTENNYARSYSLELTRLPPGAVCFLEYLMAILPREHYKAVLGQLTENRDACKNYAFPAFATTNDAECAEMFFEQIYLHSTADLWNLKNLRVFSSAWGGKHFNVTMRNTMFLGIAKLYADRKQLQTEKNVEDTEKTARGFETMLASFDESSTSTAMSTEVDGDFANLLSLLVGSEFAKQSGLGGVEEQLSDFIVRDRKKLNKEPVTDSEKLINMPHFPLIKSLLLSSLQTGVPFASLAQRLISEVNSNDATSTQSLAHALHFIPLLDYLVEIYTANGKLKEWTETAQRIQNDVRQFNFDS